jgi:hypothetical protein
MGTILSVIPHPRSMGKVTVAIDMAFDKNAASKSN